MYLHKIKAFVILTYFTVTSFTAVLSQSINNSLIESTILINIDSIKDRENYLPSGRRVLSIDQETEIENSIDFDELQPELVESQALIDGLKTVFENIVVEHCSHLKFLEGARATIRKHYKDSDARAPTHGVNSGRARISTGGT